jgi:hypothetical protein
LRGGFCIGDSALTDAPAAHENLSLEQFFALTGLALHVVDGVDVLYVSVKSENHEDPENLFAELVNAPPSPLTLLQTST